MSLATDFDALMVRYNAAHRGAEESVFPAARAARRRVHGDAMGSSLDPVGPTSRATLGLLPIRALSHPEGDVVPLRAGERAEIDEALVGLERGPMSPDELAEARRIGDAVRAHRESAPPFRKRDYVTGVLRSIREHGLTEDVISRFNR